MLLHLLSVVTALGTDPSLHLHSDALGVAIDLPTGGEVISRNGQGGSAFLIRQATAGEEVPPSWSLLLESITAAGATPESCLREVLEARLPADLVPEPFDPIVLSLQGRPAAVAWVERPAGDRTALLGWMAAPQALGRCLVVSAVTTTDAPPSIITALEASMATTRLLDSDRPETGLQADLARGKEALNLLSEERLRSLSRRQEVLRIYDPTTTPPTELGYGTLAYEVARSSDVGTPVGAGAPQDQEGLLATTHLRFVNDAEAGTYTDRVQTCWVSWDLKSEVWLDSATQREGDVRTTTEEVGVRVPPSVGTPAGQLLVVRQGGDHGARATTTTVPGDPWLPRGLRWAIWDLIGGQPPARAAWFVWDDSTATPRMTIRHDRWEGSDTCWTWAGVEGLPTALRFDSNGQWSSARRPGGVVIEQSDQETVTRRWQEAGLRLR